MLKNKCYIREIFQSIQGEGPYIGCSHVFIRFCGCNLSCKYCDTDFDKRYARSFSPEELVFEINKYGKNLTVALTGGEPLLFSEFLSEFLPMLKEQGHAVYLETNGPLPKELKKIIKYVDIVSADIKLPSAAEVIINTNDVSEFFSIAKEKELFAKVVFNSKINENEINYIVDIATKNNIEIILQPEMSGDKPLISPEKIEDIYNKICTKYCRVRLIPQMHKFIGLR